ncbi:MAG: hypothetical protein IT392_13645 [Nitrospirae bacterium]|nr:hypothetical protein [Nitrospirota bacterium]
MVDGDASTQRLSSNVSVNKIVRLAAFAGLLYFLLQKAKKEGGLSGNKEGWKFNIDSDKIVDTLMPGLKNNPKYHKLARKAAGYMVEGINKKGNSK